MNINLKPMTDEQILKLAKAEWMSILAQLWLAVGKPVEKRQFEVYVKQLEYLHLGLLEAAVAQVLSTHVYNSVPTIAEVVQAVELITPNDWQDIGYIHIYDRPNKKAAIRARNRSITSDDYKNSWNKK